MIYGIGLKDTCLELKTTWFKLGSVACKLLGNPSEHLQKHPPNNLVLRTKMMNVKHLAQCFTYNTRSEFTAFNIAQNMWLMNLILNLPTSQTSISESFFAPLH